MSRSKFKMNDIVRIKQYPKGDVNEFGRVTAVAQNGKVHVSNMNMPFLGTVCKFFNPDEIEHKKKSKAKRNGQ